MRNMLKSRANVLCLLTAALLGGAAVVQLGVPVSALAQEPGLQAPARSSAGSARPTGAALLGAGDRLKISFFEMIDVGSGGPASKAGTGLESMLRTFYQRMDLSAEYTVDQDGTISLPRIGMLPVAGRTMPELQADLSAAFVRSTGRSADVNIAIVDRRPIYVVGPVKNSGAVKYVQDMFVLQAVALAGGIEREAGSTAELIEAVREAERVAKLSDRMNRLMARSARLEAERLGAAEIGLPPQLVAFAGEQGAGTILASEQAVFKLGQTRRRQQYADAAAFVDTTRKEVDALRSKLVQLDTQRRIRAEQLGEMSRLKSVGLTTRRGVVVTQTELAEIEGRRSDLHATLAVAEARLSQAERAWSRLSYEHAGELLNAISTSEAEIAETRVALESADRLAGMLMQRSARAFSGAVESQPVYEILRRSASGTVTLAADETTELLPGDVLKVSLAARGPSGNALQTRRQAGFAVPQNPVK